MADQELMSTSMSSMALANAGEIDIQVATARAYPRDIARCVSDIDETIRALGPELAESLYYVLAHYKDDEGRPVEGPSVRMAEVCAGAWGNLRIKSEIVEDGSGNGKRVVVRAMAWDLERNIAISAERSASIIGKRGRYSDNMITTTILATTGKAKRDAIFSVIPKHIVKSLTVSAKQLATQAGDLPDRRVKLLKFFAGKGVHEDRVLAYLGVDSVDDITPVQLADMRGIANAIKDGQQTVADVFGGEEQAADPQDLEALADRIGGK